MNRSIIREDINQYMRELKAWLAATEADPLQEMAAFFEHRIGGYEAHMARWNAAYRELAQRIPKEAKTLLDLGCGTGLELKEVFHRLPALSVTGIDLSDAMLALLREKYPQVLAVCADYFNYPLGTGEIDVAVSFESLHHFKPEKKESLFQKIHQALKPGGIFLEADYIACCVEEETLLMETADRRRRRDRLSDEIFVHFDTPLTAEHELDLLRKAGFHRVALTGCIDGVCMIEAKKEVL